MNDNVIRFPGGPPTEPEPEPGVDPEATPASPMPTDEEAFNEWRDSEAADFLAHAHDLDGADRVEFRRVALRLLGQINGWLTSDG